MASVLSSHALQPGAATDRLLDSFGLAERDGLIEEAGAAVAFSTVFLQDDADAHDEGHELMLQRLQAAIAGAGGSAGSSGATTAHASSSASSDSGADAHGDDNAWKVAVMEGIEDLLHLGPDVVSTQAGGGGGAGSRRFSFDLTGIDMATLEQLTSATMAASPGPSSRRGSISLSFLEAEGIMMPKLYSTAPAATAPAPTRAPVVKSEPSMAASDDSSTTAATTASTGLTDASSVATSSSSGTAAAANIKRKAPASAGSCAGTKRKLAAVATKEEEEAPASPSLTSAAAMMLPTPQTPHHKAGGSAAISGDVTSATGARGASAATTAAMASLAAAAATSGTGGPSYALPVLPNDGQKRVGIYTVEERKARVARFQAKRHLRVWKKAVKYACRKNLADNRPRVKGRFVKREEEIDILVGSAMAASSAAQVSLLDQLIGLDDLLAE